MDDIFKEYDFIHVYVDDMLISLKNLDQHLKHLEKFIDLCISNGIGLSRKKTIIGEPKIDFLGLIIDSKGIELKTRILEKIKKLSRKTIR